MKREIPLLLTFLAGMTVSDGQDGNMLPALQSGAKVTLAVLSVGHAQPGADLTVVIRL